LSICDIVVIQVLHNCGGFFVRNKKIFKKPCGI
jgi:hypothetical protein